MCGKWGREKGGGREEEREQEDGEMENVWKTWKKNWKLFYVLVFILCTIPSLVFILLSIILCEFQMHGFEINGFEIQMLPSNRALTYGRCHVNVYTWYPSQRLYDFPLSPPTVCICSVLSHGVETHERVFGFGGI